MTETREETAVGAPHLWEATVPRWNSAVGMVLFAAFGVVILGVAVHRVAKDEMAVTVVLWSFGLAASWGACVFGRWVLWPPLAIAATEAGLITFLQVDKGKYGLPGFLVPWSEIERLSYETYVSGGRRRRHALVVHLRPGHAPMPVEKISLQRQQDVLFWNAWSAAIGKWMVSELAPFLRRFSSSSR